jgi:chromosome condensin MukBEF MukE localization factor
MQINQRLGLLWNQIKDKTIGQIVEDVRTYARNVEAGADPIEALHGHLCGPGCTHWDHLTEEQRDRLEQAPWNQKK